MLRNIVTILASEIMLQKTVIYIFINVYQEHDFVCVCVCVWSTLCGLSCGFIDTLGNAVLLTSSKSYVVLF